MTDGDIMEFYEIELFGLSDPEGIDGERGWWEWRCRRRCGGSGCNLGPALYHFDLLCRGLPGYLEERLILCLQGSDSGGE